jgi:phosphoglycerate dehydrogenase-like enzyme
MSKILVLYDKWNNISAKNMWRESFLDAFKEDIYSHEFVYTENIEGTYKWSTDLVNNVKEAYGNPEHIKQAIDECDIVVSGYAPITQDIIDASEKLKLIGISRGSPVNVDNDYASKKGIIVLKALGRNAESVADHTVALILSELRHTARLNKEIKSGEYFQNIKDGRSQYLGSFNWMEANGKILGLIGYGQIGSRVAKRAQAFNMKVIVNDPYIENRVLLEGGCTPASLETVLSESDFISIHAKLTDETYHMINYETLERMKPTAVLINTARGSIIDENALYKALKNGVITSAAIDVFEDDPIKPDNPLISLDNIRLTPHTAGRSPFTEIRGYQQIALLVAKYLRCEQIEPKYISNKLI